MRLSTSTVRQYCCESLLGVLQHGRIDVAVARFTDQLVLISSQETALSQSVDGNWNGSAASGCALGHIAGAEQLCDLFLIGLNTLS
jgi:hypothetical protein